MLQLRCRSQEAFWIWTNQSGLKMERNDIFNHTNNTNPPTCEWIVYSLSAYSCQSPWPCGLRRRFEPLDCWDCGFESRWGHGYSSLVFAVLCRPLRRADQLFSVVLLNAYLFYCVLSRNFKKSGLDRNCGARGSLVVKALRYKPAGRGFDSRWCHWNFSVT